MKLTGVPSVKGSTVVIRCLPAGKHADRKNPNRSGLTYQKECENDLADRTALFVTRPIQRRSVGPRTQAGDRRTDGEGILLPNGWALTPAGRHVVLTDLPLNILPFSDNRRVLVATSGYNKHELSLLDIQQHKVIASESVPESWFGLAASRDQGHIWWSGGGRGLLYEYTLKQGTLTPKASELSLASRRAASARNGLGEPHSFRSGLFLDAEAKTLYSSTSMPERFPRSI